MISKWSGLVDAHRWRKDRAAVVLLSGGMDSTVCAHVASEIYPIDRVVALLIDYGQPHRNNELHRAGEVAAGLKIRSVRLCIADAMHALRPVERLANSSHDPSATGPHPATVPGRNLVLLSLGAAHGCAWFDCAVDVWIGATLDDARFVDCRSEFVQQAMIALTYGCGKSVGIVAPLLEMRKRELVEVVASNPEVLAAVKRSWSCYRGGSHPCEECTPCVLRSEAFAAARIADDSIAPVAFGGDPSRERK